MNEAFVLGFIQRCSENGMTSAEAGLALKTAAVAYLEAQAPGAVAVAGEAVKKAGLTLDQIVLPPAEIGDIELPPLKPNVF